MITKSRITIFALITAIVGFLSCNGRHLNTEAASPGSKADEIIASLEIQRGMKIADIGAGGGYFSLKFAALTGETGKVYAVDINRKYLQNIRTSAEKENLGNIDYIAAEPDDSKLPEKSADLIFIRSTFHHFGTPVDYMKRLIPALRPGGRVAIIDYNSSSFMFGHRVSEEEILDVMKKAGYAHIARYDFLKRQSFNVFRLR
jgi:ubiquinone/menaquinone biosynthesis C-methylase UbiE